MLTFDLESDELLPKATQIHTLTIHDDETNRFTRYDKQAVPQGLARLSEADCICGHNIIGFDIPLIKKLYPEWQCPELVIDTLIWSRLVCTNIKDTDFGLYNKGMLNGKLIGSHSLEAWGYRLGILKGDYGKQENAWKVWTPAMSEYCEQDVRVTVRLYAHLESLSTSHDALSLELATATIIARQENRGVQFNMEKAQALYEKLLKAATVKKEELQTLVPRFFVPKAPYTDFIPKRTNAKMGYVEGAACRKIELIEFNPNSRQHIALLLHKLYDWKPEEWNEKERSKLVTSVAGWESVPTINDEILEALEYPVAKPIAEYMTLVKRLGQLSDGDKAWFKYYNEATQSIHGGVNTLGTVSGRMSHHAPNLAQVPAVYSPYGAECRELFEARKGYKFVGCDADGLEARVLAHFLYPYDNGEYAHAVLKGRKEDKTDVHSMNWKALGDICKSRDIAKRFFYAWSYGAGVNKIARVLQCTLQEAKQAITNFVNNMPALKALKNDITKALKKRNNFLRGLDGRLLYSRSPHSALNLICQSAGAVVMKRALVITEVELTSVVGLTPEVDYGYVLNVHDEIQSEVKDDDRLPDVVGQTVREAIIKAGEYYNLRCPLDGEYKIGNNWKETH